MWVGAVAVAVAVASTDSARSSAAECTKFFREVEAELARTEDPDQQAVLRYQAVLGLQAHCPSIDDVRAALGTTASPADVQAFVDDLRTSCTLSVRGLRTKFQGLFPTSALERFRSSRLCHNAWALPEPSLPSGVEPVESPLFLDRGTLDVATGEHAIWVTLNSGPTELVRVDPTTLRVAARLRLAKKAPESQPAERANVEFGEGAVWVFDESALWRVDPSTNKVVARIPMRDDLGNARGLAVGGGSVWITDNFDIYRVDPTTNRKRLFSDAVVTDAVAWAADSLWALDDSGLTRFDPATGSVSATIPLSVNPNAKLSSSDGWLWVLDARDPTASDGSVLRVDPATGAVTATAPVARLSDDVLGVAGAVWVSSGQEGFVRQIDLATGATVKDLRFPGGTRLASDGHSLWTTGPHALFRCACT